MALSARGDPTPLSPRDPLASSRLSVSGALQPPCPTSPGLSLSSPPPSRYAAMQSKWLEETLQGQLLASEIVDECFHASYEIVNTRYFDRLAVPYAVQWASRQMLDALMGSFCGADTGLDQLVCLENCESAEAPTGVASSSPLTAELSGWEPLNTSNQAPRTAVVGYVDPVPARTPIDTFARGTLRVIYKPAPVVPPTPLSLSTDNGSSKRRRSRRRSSGASSLNDSQMTSPTSQASSTSPSPTNSSFATRRSIATTRSISPSTVSITRQKPANNSSSSSGPLAGGRGGGSKMGKTKSNVANNKNATQPPSPSEKRERAETAPNASVASTALSIPLSTHSSSHREKNEKSVERERAEAVEIKIAELLRAETEYQMAKSQKKGNTKLPPAPSPFVADVLHGEVVVVQQPPTTHAPTAPIMRYDVSTPANAKRPPVGGTTATTAASISAPSSKTLPLPKSGAGKGSTTAAAPSAPSSPSFYHEDGGQNFQCKILKPAAGVALKEGDSRTTRSEMNAGDGRMTKTEFEKRKKLIPERLPSAEGSDQKEVAKKQMTLDEWNQIRASRGAKPLEPLAAHADDESLLVDLDTSLNDQYLRLISGAGKTSPPPPPALGGASSVTSLSLAQGGGGGKKKLHHLPPTPGFGGGLSSLSRTQGLDTSAGGGELKVQSAAALPLRRLPPLSSSPVPVATSSPSPSPLLVDERGGSTTAVTVVLQPYVSEAAMQRRAAMEKDAPHYRPGKSGTEMVSATDPVNASSSSSSKKEVLDFVAQQLENAKLQKERRITKVIVPSQQR